MSFLNKIKSLFIKKIEVIKEVPVEKRFEIIKEVEKPVEVVKEVVVEKTVEVIREIEVENQAFELVDNQELLVKDKIIQLVKASDRLDIATGYFYHHGYNLFREWFENLFKIADEIDEELLQKIIEAAAEEEEVLVLDDYTLRALLLSIRFLRETSKENLFYYQYEDAISVLECYNLGPRYTGVMLAHEVGLGKTIITAKVIKTLIEKGAIKKILIATPASLCE